LISHEFRSDLNQYLSLFESSRIRTLNDIVDLGLFHEAVEGALTRSRASVRNADAYGAAVAGREELRGAIERVFDEHNLDAMVYPPIAELQVFIGESQPGNNCSISANSGLPALSMPAGFTDSGLPVGMELLGGFFDDARLLAIAQTYELDQQTRQAPSTTPPLVDGIAPTAAVTALVFNQQGARFESSFEFDLTTNLLNYELAVADSNSAEIYAVTLIIDHDEAIESNDPIVLNLMGPGVAQSSGSYFMSPDFRQSYVQQRVYLKVFADSLPLAGATRRLR
jgi:amidase